MKRNLQHATGIFHLLFAGIFLWTLLGCATNRHAVIATTQTIIGVELGKDATTQAPTGKVGYNRSEFAYVPTNRNSIESAKDSHGGGATDIPDVLMELRYDGILSANSGIYQRLAVGPNAVKQAGAALMFAKDQDGALTTETVREVNKTIETLARIKEPSTESVKSFAPIARIHSKYLKENNSVYLNYFEQAAQKIKGVSYREMSDKWLELSMEDIRKFTEELLFLDSSGIIKTDLEKAKE